MITVLGTFGANNCLTEEKTGKVYEAYSFPINFKDVAGKRGFFLLMYDNDIKAYIIINYLILNNNEEIE